ncbi:hypothetical protein LX64_01843 [Chitinophaga skermanii]|uniref:Uncharacterized protein n=1 Tax=Chitinophaga skermanii TaxID=331697 RepID=A0A327QQ21_9BACT|nr:hypothetical protein LX64_01843 [Chitinophaga skermanii]
MFFDYLFYLVAKFYARNREKETEGTSITVVSLLQTFNLLTIWFIIIAIYYPQEYLLKIVSVGIYFFFLIFNYIRFFYREKHLPSVIHDKWLKESKKSQKEIKLTALFYVVISIVSFLGVVVYMGLKNTH